MAAVDNTDIIKKVTLKTLSPNFWRICKLIERNEKNLFILLLVVVLVLRVGCIFYAPINSDEPQHLHVIWSWTQGLVQYRDVFDNHAPMFHLVMAPIMAILGEHPDIIVVMRLVLLPIFLAILWAAYSLSRSLFGKSVALWTTLYLSTTLYLGIPSYSLRKSIEFRPASLWILLWLLILLSLVKGNASRKSGFKTGVLSGTALCVSLKTILILSSLFISGLLLHIVYSGEENIYKEPVPWIGGLTLGISLIPLVIIAFFSSLGALHSLFYCTISHNIIPGNTLNRLHNLPVSFLLILAIVIVLKKLVSSCYVATNHKKIIFLILVTGVYSSLLKLYPVLERQTEISLFPLYIILSLGIAYVILEKYNQYKCEEKPSIVNHKCNPLPLLIIPLILISLCQTTSRIKSWNKHLYNTSEKKKRKLKSPLTYKYLLGDVLELTSSSDYVMDSKGQNIYRQRPFYYALELFTKKRLRLGLIRDSIIKNCITTKTKVVIMSKYYPLIDKKFFLSQFIEIDQRTPALRVVGHLIGCRNSHRSQTFPINVVIPARYVIVAEKGKVTGLLDGKPYNGPRFLAAGRHVFRATGGKGWLALVWARALERGFQPIIRAGACSG